MWLWMVLYGGVSIGFVLKFIVVVVACDIGLNCSVCGYNVYYMVCVCTHCGCAYCNMLCGLVLYRFALVSIA